MLNDRLAAKFVKEIALYTEYNVNIFDKNGITIASRDTSRVGTFHEVAYNMVKNNQETAIVRDNDIYQGAIKGVNLLVVLGQDVQCVVGVTGEPEQVYNIAMIIKMALETMIRHENEMHFLLKQKTEKDIFYHTLFKAQNTPSKASIEEYSKKFNYKVNQIRIPILISLKAEQNPEKTLAEFTSSEYCSPQDMNWVQDGTHILIYKALFGEEKEILSAYKILVTEWINDTKNIWGECCVYVGAMQCRMHRYKNGLETCLWVEGHIEKQTAFFYEHIEEYIMDYIPRAELYNIFNVYNHILPENEKEFIIELVSSLRKNDYNMLETSKALFIHKNTLQFRINKLKNILNVNFHAASDRVFLEFLIYSLQSEERAKNKI